MSVTSALVAMTLQRRGWELLQELPRVVGGVRRMSARLAQ